MAMLVITRWYRTYQRTPNAPPTHAGYMLPGRRIGSRAAGDQAQR